MSISADVASQEDSEEDTEVLWWVYTKFVLYKALHFIGNYYWRFWSKLKKQPVSQIYFIFKNLQLSLTYSCQMCHFS